MTDSHPFTKLLPLQSRILYRRALRLTVNPHRAEDLVQATLLKAWIHRDRFQLDTNLRAWLFTIMRNTFLSELRKYRLEVEDNDDALALTVAEEARQDHALALKELMTAISDLPAAQRQPLLMMGYYGFSQLETADACSCTLGTVKSRVSRGRATLSRLLAHDEIVSGADRKVSAVRRNFPRGVDPRPKQSSVSHAIGFGGN
jgi:RNA polymerase sigma-70 factor, ECF subfamily